LVEELSNLLQTGAKLIYLDDNFLEMPAAQQNLLTEEQSDCPIPAFTGRSGVGK
jgi:hypothetical protein